MDSSPAKLSVEEVQAEKVEIPFSDGEQDNDSDSSFQKASHCIKMENINIFALSKRVCDYGTISYEVNEWHEWLVVKNKLSYPIVLRVKLTEESLGVELVAAG